MSQRKSIERWNVARAAQVCLSFTLFYCMVIVVGCGSGERTASSPDSAGSAALPEAARGGEVFEGTIAMKMNTPSQEGMEMTYFIKGDKSRIEAKFGDNPHMQGVMLWDLAAGKMTTLIPQQKMYMTMDLKGLGEGMIESSDETKEPEFPKLTPTGKQETVAGHTCEHWLIGDKQDIDMCLAKGLGYFGMGGGGAMAGLGSLKSLMLSPKLLTQAAAHPEWVKLLEGGAFPLKMTFMEDGQIKMQMEATRIEQKKLDDGLFAIPVDYTELTMPRR